MRSSQGGTAAARRSTPERLRVAIVSTCALATPPRAYGGTELVLADLARALRDLGHLPAVFATGDSTCVGARRGPFEAPMWPPDDLAELRHACDAWEQITATGEFDVVHVNQACALPFTHFAGVPTVATVHHERVPALTRHYAAYPEVAFVAISRRQAELAWESPVRAVVHHGLDVDRYPFGAGGDSCAFLGRFAAAKGPHLAIDAARRAGVRISLGGEAHPPELAFFRREVEPRLGRVAVWLGELDQPQKVALLQASSCLLVPIQWEEPFGLVMIESMLVGTPVVAFACGAAPEIVDDGITGVLVHSVDEMARAIPIARRLDRRRCRAVACHRWSSLRMARAYAEVYGDVIARSSVARPPRTMRRGAPHAESITARPR